MCVTTCAWRRDVPGSLALFRVTEESGEGNSQGLHRKKEEGNDSVLPPRLAFPKLLPKGHLMGLGLGKRTR